MARLTIIYDESEEPRPAPTVKFAQMSLVSTNARLIVAAPELYAALARFVEAEERMDLCSIDPEIVSCAKAALAKARGEEPR